MTALTNPIPRSGLFATPASADALYAHIQRFPSVERALAFQVAMMTFNLCNQLVESKIIAELDKESTAG